MDEEALNKLIRDTINTIVGVTGFAIKANQKDAPRPPGSYASVDLVSSTAVGWDSIKYEDGVTDLDVTLEGQRTGVFQIDYFRDDARNNARDFITAIQRPSILNTWNEQEVGFISITGPIDTSDALTSGWEERFTITITVNHVYVDTSTVEAIESIDISTSVDGYDNTLPITNN